MIATVRHVTSSLGLRKFQTDGFLFVGVYQNVVSVSRTGWFSSNDVTSLAGHQVARSLCFMLEYSRFCLLLTC